MLVVSDSPLGPLLLLLLTKLKEFFFLEFVDGGGATFVGDARRFELIVKSALERFEIRFPPRFPACFKLRDRLGRP